MTPADVFHHCPRCGRARDGEAPAGNAFDCAGCGFRFHFNVASATGVLLLDAAGRMLFIRRAKDPAKGMLAFPGGFTDPNETAEDALRREIQEEVGLEVASLAYLCSHPNPYLYRGITYPVLDLFFVAHLAESADALAVTAQVGEVDGYLWRAPSAVDPEELAFPSMRFAMRRYLSAPTDPAE